jgi:copper chaperone
VITSNGEQMEHVTLNIESMTCGHCVSSVRRALSGVDGATVEQVALGSATIAYDPARTSPEQLAAAVTNEGYAATPEGGAVAMATPQRGGCGCGCG